MSEREITFKDAIAEALYLGMQKDPSIFVVGDDMLDLKQKSVTGNVREKFSDRIIETPLIEDMVGGIGLGMSMGGLVPIINLNCGAFLTLAVDAIYRLGVWRYRMAENVNPRVIFRIGQYGCLGRGPEISASFLATVLHLPNILIFTPSTPYYAKGLLLAALTADKPVLFFEHKKLYELKGPVPDEGYATPLCVSTVLRPGQHVTIISWMYTSYMAMEAARLLAREGIEAEVIVLHTLNPIDTMTVFSSANKTHRVVIVEEDMLRGGVGAEVGAQIAEHMPNCLIKRVASKNVPLAPGRSEVFVAPTVNEVAAACKTLLL